MAALFAKKKKQCQAKQDMSQSHDKHPQKNGSSMHATHLCSYLTTLHRQFFTIFARTEVRGQGHSDPETVCETASKDISQTKSGIPVPQI